MLSSFGVVILNFVPLNISAKVATIANDNIIPTYGGRPVITLKMGTNIIPPNHNHNIVVPILVMLLSSLSTLPTFPLKGFRNDAAYTGTTIHTMDGMKT